MAAKGHKPEEIVLKLRQIDALIGLGLARVDAVRQANITEQTYYNWRKQCRGMETDQSEELKKLQKQDELLRPDVADITLDKRILDEIAGEASESCTSSQMH